MNRIRRISLIMRIVIALALSAGSLAAQPSAVWKTAGTVDFGFMSATGNTDVTTITTGEKATATRGLWTFSQSLAYVYGKTKGVESANQLRLMSRVERALGQYFGGFAGAQFERNAYAGFNSRLEQLIGLQWKPVADSANVLTVDAGAVLTQQENTDRSSRRSPSARGAMLYRHNFRPNTYVAQGVEYVPNLEESGAYRLNTETALVAPLSARLGIKVSYVLQYNSRPPVKFGTTDRVFTSGLQLTL